MKLIKYFMHTRMHIGGYLYIVGSIYVKVIFCFFCYHYHASRFTFCIGMHFKYVCIHAFALFVYLVCI